MHLFSSRLRYRIYKKKNKKKETWKITSYFPSTNIKTKKMLQSYCSVFV
uniref:Uncharacterized protein n=1 Tax=Anguilla anguilla TaxID=7936 RepID=A0A0E9WJQ9_ANGAN